MHWGTRAGVTVAVEGQKVASLPPIKITDVASSLFLPMKYSMAGWMPAILADPMCTGSSVVGLFKHEVSLTRQMDLDQEQLQNEKQGLRCRKAH